MLFFFFESFYYFYFELSFNKFIVLRKIYIEVTIFQNIGQRILETKTNLMLDQKRISDFFFKLFTYKLMVCVK